MKKKLLALILTMSLALTLSAVPSAAAETAKPAKTSISSISAKNQKVTLSWKKVSGADGYKIYYTDVKDSSTLKVLKTIQGASTTSYTTAKSLEKNKTYYFCVRTYKVVNGKTCLSAKSAIKSIKITNSTNQNGNGTTNGNLMNRGYFAAKDGWIYLFTNYSDSDGGLYKIRPDGTGKKKLVDGEVRSINVVGDWIYYANWHQGVPYGDGSIHKIRTDGTKDTKLNSDSSLYVNVVGDWIYYINRYHSDRIYRIRTDGTERTMLSEDRSDYMNVVGDWIYYVNRHDSEKLYKMRTDGTGRTKVCDGSINAGSSASEYFCLNVTGDWIYYKNVEDLTFNKIRTDGTGKTKLYEGGILTFNVVGDWIYYINLSEGGVYKMRTDGTGKTKVDSKNAENFGWVDEADDGIYLWGSLILNVNI